MVCETQTIGYQLPNSSNTVHFVQQVSEKCLVNRWTRRNDNSFHVCLRRSTGRNKHGYLDSRVWNYGSPSCWCFGAGVYGMYIGQGTNASYVFRVFPSGHQGKASAPNQRWRVETIYSVCWVVQASPEIKFFIRIRNPVHKKKVSVGHTCTLKKWASDIPLAT